MALIIRSILLFCLSFGGVSQTLLAQNGYLGIGAEAPDFSLQADSGKTIKLSDYFGKKFIVLYFYSRDFTPGCSLEAEGFRGDLELIKATGAEVLGVSVDNIKSHRGFANKLKLNFPLLSDSGGKIAKLYGAMGVILSKRVTYIIGANGRIIHVFSNVDVRTHSKDVLKVLRLQLP